MRRLQVRGFMLIMFEVSDCFKEDRYNMSSTDTLPPQWKLERKSSGQPVLHTGFGKPFSLEMSKLATLKPGQPLRKAIGYKGTPSENSGHHRRMGAGRLAPGKSRMRSHSH